MTAKITLYTGRVVSAFWTDTPDGIDEYGCETAGEWDGLTDCERRTWNSDGSRSPN